MSAAAIASDTVQVHRVYIKAPIERVWEALVSPEWTDRYGYGGTCDYDLTPGAPYVVQSGVGMKAVGYEGPVVDGEVLEADPPNRLVLTWRMVMDEQMKAAGFTKITYELAEEAGVTKLTVVHDLTNVPAMGPLLAGESGQQGAGGGWPWVLSDLKSLLETGEAFSARGAS